MAINLVGFDSAWADNPKKPGAICALRLDGADDGHFEPPHLVGFDAAATFIERRHRDGDLTLIALDQPTIVPNIAGMRPAERVVASLISWSGGAIQPAFRGKSLLFGDDAPIWRFLSRLSPLDDPEAVHRGGTGCFVMEVYPALALLAFDPEFTARGKAGPRYNPLTPTFRQQAWHSVCDAVSREAQALGFKAVACWCDALDRVGKPRKATQDKLDAVVCLVVAMIWLRHRERCVMIGDLDSGYIIGPVAPTSRARLSLAAGRRGVPIA